jgi:hypothetical protein
MPGAQVVSVTFKMLMVTNESLEVKMTNVEWDYAQVHKYYIKYVLYFKK